MNVNLTKTGATAVTKRAAYYETLATQLDKLYHDIDSGKLGDDAKTGDFYVGRKAVKDKYPK
jgi:hypothetical protein|tara:strand:+ start:502 stop:687 length:186 start_codon:yes stop_codon:yes gene_type:complete